MEKVLQELFWVQFFGWSYRSNSSKIHMDVALVSHNASSLTAKKVFRNDLHCVFDFMI